MRYTVIDGRIDGQRRRKVIQQLQLVLGRTHTFEFRCGAAYMYIYTANYPPASK